MSTDIAMPAHATSRGFRPTGPATDDPRTAGAHRSSVETPAQAVTPGATARALRSLMTRIALSDLAVVTSTMLLAQVLRFGSDDPVLRTGGPGAAGVAYSLVTPLLMAAWLIALRLHGAYDHRLVGHGSEEFRVVCSTSFRVFAVIALVCFAAKLPLARGYIAVALPVGTLSLLGSRWLWRCWLRRQRAQGRLSGAVLLVGDRDSLGSLVESFGSVPGAGYRVVAACCSDADGSFVDGVPVVGDVTEAAEMARRLGVDTVACASSWRLGAVGLRQLGWALEGLGIDLVVAPGLTDVAGPRIRTRPVAGLPVLHVEAPVFAGPRLAVKTLIDRVGAAVLLLVFGPLFLVLAGGVWLQDRGPIFFSHHRVGREGKPFRMHKFRTMVVDAEALLPELLASEGIEAGPCYKVRRDPRVTRLGGFLRRFSLDELPQLFNVLTGEMSLVGPRPQVQFEVESYASDARRRLLVKPGMTGLWQVNGRSNLSWEQAVRFDLYYVENWSVLLDLTILWRTARAVVRSSGAY